MMSQMISVETMTARYGARIHHCLLYNNKPKQYAGILETLENMQILSLWIRKQYLMIQIFIASVENFAKSIFK